MYSTWFAVYFNGCRLYCIVMNKSRRNHSLALSDEDQSRNPKTVGLGIGTTMGSNMSSSANPECEIICNILDELYYSDSDEQVVLKVLRGVAKEPDGLDLLFDSLANRHKNVGVVAEQKLSYYSILFNRFDSVDELRTLRDSFSTRYRGDDGVKELNFGEYFWQSVESGEVAENLGHFGAGVGEGVKAAAIGVYQMIRHPIEAAEGMAELVINYDKTIDGIDEILSEYLEASKNDPEKFAKMTGELVGLISISIVSPAKVLKGQDVVGAAKTAAKMGKRTLGLDSSLYHYTNAAGAKGIAASNTISKGGGKGAFATAMAPELAGSGSVASLIAQNLFLGGRIDILRKVGEELKIIFVKPPFTHVVEFMSPEFKILARTKLEPGLLKWSKSILAQYGATGDQVVNLIMKKALSEPMAAEALINGLGYVVTSAGMVVNSSESYQARLKP